MPTKRTDKTSSREFLSLQFSISDHLIFGKVSFIAFQVSNRPKSNYSKFWKFHESIEMLLQNSPIRKNVSLHCVYVCHVCSFTTAGDMARYSITGKMLFSLSRSVHPATLNNSRWKNTKLMVFNRLLFVYLSRASSYYPTSRARALRNTCWFVT